mgnify:CR=1 FL=1
MVAPCFIVYRKPLAKPVVQKRLLPLKEKPPMIELKWSSQPQAKHQRRKINENRHK